MSISTVLWIAFAVSGGLLFLATLVFALFSVTVALPAGMDTVTNAEEARFMFQIRITAWSYISLALITGLGAVLATLARFEFI